MLDDSRIAHIRRTFEGRPAAAADRLPEHREAAVAVVLRPREAVELLLIRRAELRGDPWSGHVALPGGRRDPDDEDLLATACRETEEEVGIPLRHLGTFLGTLDEVAPSSPRLPPIVVAPFVLAVPPETIATPDPREVQAAFWVPLDALRDSSAASELLIESTGGPPLRFPSLTWDDYVVWGLTYRIVQQLLEISR